MAGTGQDDDVLRATLTKHFEDLISASSAREMELCLPFYTRDILEAAGMRLGGRGCCTPCSGTRPRPAHFRPAAPCTSLASLPRVCARPCVVRRRGWVVCRACPACWCTIRRGNRRVWVCMGQLLCLASAVLLCVRGACACELCDFWWLERIYA